ncbi:Rhamnogalacturonate lyase [Ceratobasidium theobromae]|uniref:rhamnogalacturonan endolyase n=1 Tax=Ceratobasidium theobromae TaxID=1582974 RepID=A0A5N5QWE3_9AGAM|nr:Rhamnogalacturonate lyase [Ceratobasidium theobromae]
MRGTVNPFSAKMGPHFKSSLLALLSLTWQATATLVLSETSSTFTLQNDRLKTTVAKPSGIITAVTLDGTSLLGKGQGLYLDCYCTPSGFYVPGSTSPTLELLNGTDSTGTKWGGIALRETYKPTGQVFEQLWFLRDGETGLHSFTRIAYFNETNPFLRNLQELRTLFRPTTNLWTHLSTNEKQWGPLPSTAAVAAQVVAQDATWYLGNTPNDPYYQQVADYFTKYTFADSWRDHKAHGLYADGSTSNGTAYGAWLVMNTRDTYFGGPIHSDLTVDGITYNYIVSNHHGDGLPTLRADAEKLADPTWNAEFYDSIASHVPNYVTTSGRGTFRAKIKLPNGAKKPLAVLSVSGYDFQANEIDTKALQYWGDIKSDGSIEIPRVKAGNYRLTVYADGIFGQYVQDNIEVKAGNSNSVAKATWVEESAGKELWRLGTPDKTAGEFRHGFAPDSTKSLHLEEYRTYWGYWDFPTDFPNGVNFTIGKSDIAKDWNYIHWSVFGPSYTRKTAVWDNMNNWTINFDYTPQKSNKKVSTATLTIQLAGAKTASGNTDVDNGQWTNFDLNVVVNGNSPLPFHIPWYQSSSCGVRSGISCYNLGEKLKFPATWLKNGHNSIVLSLPFNATDIETAVLPASIYVQYDALRLEVS